MDAIQMVTPKTAYDNPSNAPDPRTLTWKRLEDRRLQQLGLSIKYSRYFNVLRTKHPQESFGREDSFDLSGSTVGLARAVQQANQASGCTGSTSGSQSSRAASSFSKANSIAPFATQGKPTCGYFFNDVTNNRKRKFGIPPSDLVKWRNFSAN